MGLPMFIPREARLQNGFSLMFGNFIVAGVSGLWCTSAKQTAATPICCNTNRRTKKLHYSHLRLMDERTPGAVIEKSRLFMQLGRYVVKDEKKICLTIMVLSG